MDESLAGVCELDWFKQSSSSTAALVRSFQIGGDFGELSEAESTFSDQLITVNI